MDCTACPGDTAWKDYKPVPLANVGIVMHLSCMKGKHNSYMQNSYPSLGHGVDFTENICTPRKTALRLVT